MSMCITTIIVVGANTIATIIVLFVIVLWMVIDGWIIVVVEVLKHPIDGEEIQRPLKQPPSEHYTLYTGLCTVTHVLLEIEHGTNTYKEYGRGGGENK